jgi:kumamolisin
MMQVNSTQPRQGKNRGLIIGIIAVVVALVAGTVGGYFLFLTHPNALAKIGRKASTVFTLPGQVAPVSKKATDTGALNANMTLNLSIALPLRNQAKLNALLANINDPASPLYHQFLTPAEFRADYAPTSQAVQEVSDYLTQSGLKVTSTSASNQFIDVSSSVANIESAFHVQLHKYTYQGQSYYGPVADPGVSSSLKGLIQNISGLDNFGHWRSGAVLHHTATSSGLTPSDLQKAYDAAGLTSQGLDGTGQSIAFLELSDYQASDIQSYQQQYSLAATTPSRVQVDGGAQVDSGSIEVELDMEVAYAMAPNVNELVYEGPNSNQGMNDIYSQIVNDNKAKIVSISWGLCEAQTGSAELQTLDQIFAQGAAEGITFFSAAGDSGAYDCGDSNLGVDSPADDPNVTGVGGTTLTLNSDGSYAGESAWSCTDAQCSQGTQNGAGGGGGISQQFSQPSFQQGLNPPIPSGGQSQAARFVPDVSADADPQTGYAITCTVSAAQCTGSDVVGGTSGAAPLWAGGAALMSEYLAKQNKQLGNVNAALYTAEKTANAFHDVTSGNNLYYQAAAGYDLATGLGSPDFANLAQALASGNTGTGGNPTPTPTPGGTATPTPTTGVGTPTPTPPTGGSGNGNELLTNNGFENGQDPWAESSSGNYQLIVTSADGGTPHSGQYSALLCGYQDCQDNVAQGFQMPATVNNVTLSYWWEMQSDKSGGCADTFQVQIYSLTANSDGSYSLDQPIATAQSACDQDATGQYQQQTVDLTGKLQGQAGQALAVVFVATTNGSQNTTEVNVDDVSLQAS